MGRDPPISAPEIRRQAAEPANPTDGMLWINPSGGQNGNNAERYIYNGDLPGWELTDSTGPDTPLHPANGANWRDTGNSAQNVYQNGWKSVGVTDHANLNNVNSGQHHSRYSDGEARGAAFSVYASGSTTSPGAYELQVAYNSDDVKLVDSGGSVIMTLASGINSPAVAQVEHDNVNDKLVYEVVRLRT